MNVSPYTVPDENAHYDVFETFVEDGETHYHYWASFANEDKALIVAEALTIFSAINKTIVPSDVPLPKMVVRSRPTKAHSLHTRDSADLFPFHLDLEEPREYSHVPAEMAHQIFREDQTDEEISARMGGDFEDNHGVRIEDMVTAGEVFEDHPAWSPEAVAKRAIRAEKRKKKASKKRA